MQTNRKRPSCLAIALFALIAFGSLSGGMLIDGWLSPYRAVDLLAPDGVEAALPPDPLRDKRLMRTTGRSFMISSTHPAASQAGAEVLDQGGSALDAVMAAQAVLNLVEPQNGGFGGGGFLLHWDRKTRRLVVYDGRGAAPAAVDRRIHLDADGSQRPLRQVSRDAGAILVPGLARMLADARQDYGEFPLDRIYARAIEMARVGFPVSPDLVDAFSGMNPMPAGTPLLAYLAALSADGDGGGAEIRNPDFAVFLETLSACGLGSFYAGDPAREMVDAINGAPGAPGAMDALDFGHYRTHQRNALCRPYKGYRICGLPSPAAGGATVLQALGMMEGRQRDESRIETVESLQLLAEALRLSQADGAQYVADPDYIEAPRQGLVNRAYLQSRALEMNLGRGSKGNAVPGYPPGDPGGTYAPDIRAYQAATAHIAAVDRNGNVASLLIGFDSPFGSGQMVNGFLLNNGLIGFSPSGSVAGVPVRNRIEPGKRPRSPWASFLLFGENGNPAAVIGAGGDGRSIAYAASAIIDLVDRKLSLQNALSLPNMAYADGGILLEVKSSITDMATRLRNRGYLVRLDPLDSRLTGIEFDVEHGLIGAVDPRSGGYAISEKNMLSSPGEAFDLVIPGGSETAEAAR